MVSLMLPFPSHVGIEKCMKFINKNAYIQTAIFGYHFCKAAKCAFFLILRNIARIMALSIVSGLYYSWASSSSSRERPSSAT